MRVVDERDRRALDLALPLDIDLVGGVDHHLGDGVVAEQRLERAVAEDVVADVADELAPFFPRQRRPVERELLGDRAEHAVRQILGGLALEQLRAETRDALVVDPRLQLGIRVAALRRCGALAPGLPGRVLEGRRGRGGAVRTVDPVVEAHG